jgi:hypothetical protein
MRAKYAVSFGTTIRSVVLSAVLLLGTCAYNHLYGALAKADKGTSQSELLLRMNKPTAGKPMLDQRVHKVGNMWLTITNYGIFGNQSDASIKDPETGLPAPSCEYPGGSGMEYLFQGALWVGAIIGEDTLVSMGHDGWLQVFEMYGDEAPKGAIIKKSSRKSDPAYDSTAVSEADYIAVYTDTLTDQAFVAINPDDGRKHIPLGIKITQKSYAWSYSYAEDFILIDFLMSNIGTNEIRKAYVGLYVDADVSHFSKGALGSQDDISGFKQSVPSAVCSQLEDTINVAWIADTDGDPNRSGVFDFMSVVAVTGTRVVRTPNPELKTSFNWWVSWGDDPKLDWGPVRRENNRNLGTGGLGTPAGDKNKYFFMKNGEFDYDQLFSAFDYSSQGWLPPNPEIAGNLADGYDTRYLLSFGPFEIGVGDTLPLTIGYIAGDKFHRKPDDFVKYFDANSPFEFQSHLDYSDLATNALWAGWVYDNPGYDTDGDGFRGTPVRNPCITTGPDTLFYPNGDGIPDFKGPPPPTPPLLRYSASPGKVTIRWNGKNSETSLDPFSTLADFEGYRVYMGSKLQLNEFALLTSFDYKDYNRYRLNADYTPARWELTEIPFSLDSLRTLFKDDDFKPLDYPTQANPYMDTVGTGSGGDTAYYFFTNQDYNRSEFGGAGEIRKIYPNAKPGDMVLDPQLNEYVDAYYEYEYVIDGLLPSRPVYMSVSAFDFGNPATNLAPLESSPLANAVEIFPVYSADVVADSAKKVSVFPNPYKINGGYAEAGYEVVSDFSRDENRARRIHFANLPSEATIRIYTLDGDLVREIQHPCNCPLQEGESMTSWDLISRNTQAVVSGIYLYTVESKSGTTQVGKFVIIK